MIRGILVGILLGVVALVAVTYFYFATGLAPVAISDPMMPFERRLAHLALDAHIRDQHVGDSPIPADEPNLLAGAEIYKKECAICHGLPNHPAAYAKIMFPKPTQMFQGDGVTDDPVGESYWKTVNGIRLSGMPTFKDRLISTQIWQLSQLLAHAHELPDPVKKALTTEFAAPGSETSMGQPPF
jgi:mono/diheme cytochrome c family protein